jgi:hypothetical protein
MYMHVWFLMEFLVKLNLNSHFYLKVLEMDPANGYAHEVQILILYWSGFSKRIEVGVSIYKVGGELSGGGTNPAPQAQVGESPRGGYPPENFEILDCRDAFWAYFAIEFS